MSIELHPSSDGDDDTEEDGGDDEDRLCSMAVGMMAECG